MAELTQSEKINISLKQVFGIEGTWNPDPPNGLHWSQEEYAYKAFTLNKDLIVDAVPVANTSAEATAALVGSTIIEVRDIKLTIVPGTNARAWAAFKTWGDATSGVYDDWLQPQLFGRGYALRLFQDNSSHNPSIPASGAPGNEILTTDGAWIPNYKLGFIVLGNANTVAAMGWKDPLWVRVYRYIGRKGITGATAGVTFDDAYNAGHTVTVDAGPIVLNASTSAPIQLTPQVSAPTTNLSAGQLSMVGNTLYQYTGTKWLSVNQETPSFSARFASGNYLTDDIQGTTASGFLAKKNGTILAVAGSVGWGNMSKAFHVMKNGVFTDIYSFSLTSGKYVNDTLNIDFSAGDVLQVYADPGAQSFSPRVELTIAWRL
jgi:hypothetical protein